MTVKQLLNFGKKHLSEAGIVNYENEARWLLESVLGVQTRYIILCADSEVAEDDAKKYKAKTEERAKGEPLQYVIGSWDFYGETFCVGRGVLIPRPETELLVDYAVGILKDQPNPIITDLCSGSGCIGLSIAKKLPRSTVCLIEKSEEAFHYLQTNLNTFGCDNVFAVCGDISDGFCSFDIPLPDLIVSNPPYIATNELAYLQSEVKLEPKMALDGGTDGLDFYHIIADKWLSECGCDVAVECGEGQSEQIIKIFSEYCEQIHTITDYNGFERVVYGHGKE